MALAAMLASVGVAVVAHAAPAQAAPAQAAPAEIGGNFVPLNPARVLVDTRSGVGGVTGARGPASTTSFQVLGAAGVPSADVTAVMVDVSTVAPTAATYLTLWPDGAPRPGVSMLNAQPGELVSNSAVVPVGANGRIAVFNSAGSAHLLIDVQGYFTNDSNGGGGFVPVQHTRVVDTRTGLGTAGVAGPVPAGGTRVYSVTGGVVPTGARAVFLDVVVSGATVRSWLSMSAAGTANGRATVDFLPGTTSHGVSVGVSVGGQIAVSNRSAEPVHLALTAQGYVTADPAAGAGFRPATARVNPLAGTAHLEPNQTVDIPVAGVAGLPTGGVTGAVLNVAVVGPRASGSLQMWPAGGTNPQLSTFVVTAGRPSRAALAVVQVGAEGTVRLRNATAGALSVYVDLQGAFINPVPGVPERPGARTAVRQVSSPGSPNGPVTFAFVDGSGRVVTSSQFLGGAAVWTVLPGEAFVGPPLVVPRPDGGHQIIAQGADGGVRSFVEASSGGSPGSWQGLGGSFTSPVTAAQLADGTTVLFGVDADGRVWAYRQSDPTPHWRSLGVAGLVGQVTAVAAREGVRLIGLTAAGAVRTAVYASYGALVGGWADLGGAGFTGTPGAVTLPGSRARIVVRGPDGVIHTKAQNNAGVFDEEWAPVAGLAAVGSPVTALDFSGRVVIVARGADNLLYSAWETGALTRTFGSWHAVDPAPVATDPAVFDYHDGTYPVFGIAVRDQNDVVRVFIQQVGAAPDAAA
ncbi:MAG TPA: hypothetical protein VES42_12430, partial [Pilimelia sp.]|nr:hypothetical protein [Pilimelia sp.]